jgi:hypothetical protein
MTFGFVTMLGVAQLVPNSARHRDSKIGNSLFIGQGLQFVLKTGESGHKAGFFSPGRRCCVLVRFQAGAQVLEFQVVGGL